jgi:hypothetical protein
MNLTSAFWQEHLITFLLDVCAAIGAAWLFFRFYPRISDWSSQRSSKAAIAKIQALEKDLNLFEQEVRDPKIYVIKYLYYVLGALGCLILACSFAIMASLSSDHNIGTAASVAGIFFIFRFFTVNKLALLRVNPDRYREYMKKRADRLRRKLSQPSSL